MTSDAAGPRILTIMGSGETAPTMARVHRMLFDRLGPDGREVRAAIVDTPYGFQENADSLSDRTVEFFATSVGRPVSVASYLGRDADDVTLATAVGRIREARFVMAGPGSPSYALRQWMGGPIPEALASKLSGGGVLTMASAAALTLGIVTIPVYEIYKQRISRQAGRSSPGRMAARRHAPTAANSARRQQRRQQGRRGRRSGIP